MNLTGDQTKCLDAELAESARRAQLVLRASVCAYSAVRARDGFRTGVDWYQAITVDLESLCFIVVQFVFVACNLFRLLSDLRRLVLEIGITLTAHFGQF